MAEFEQLEHGWPEYRRLILAKLDALEKGQAESQKHFTTVLDQIRVDVVTLKEKSRSWGAIAGAISALIVTVVGGLILMGMQK